MNVTNKATPLIKNQKKERFDVVLALVILLAIRDIDCINTIFREFDYSAIGLSDGVIISDC